MPDVSTVKKYGNKYKLTYHNQKRQKGFEIDTNLNRGEINSEKLDCSISRTKAKIVEYGLCNNWDYFVTLTLSEGKYDRYNLKGYIKDLGKFLNNYNNRQLHDLPNIRYLFIPEQHKDGAWHIHGLISNLPESHLCLNSNGYMDWKPYSDKFGYMSLSKIKSNEGVSRYITKYIRKDLSVRDKELNAKLYYCSKGLKTAELLKEGYCSIQDFIFDYQNEHVKIKWFDDMETALNLIK